eukprot:a676290_1665.p2 GENE.a676290_1665~~a676290_1665.p2  ORF type:complete len:170 (+),score=71.95 a676290_1665:37-510(+)
MAASGELDYAKCNYRQINVDQWEEDLYVEAETMSSADATAAIARFETEVNNAVNRNDFAGALRTALNNPPSLQTNEEPLKKRAAEAVYRCLSGVKDADIEGMVNGLDQPSQDLLMGFVYRCMSLGQDGGKLLKFHAAIVKAAGIACIVRAMANRTTV